MKLNGKVAIVTGAARGIGRAIALHLAGLGADVLAADADFAAATRFGEVLGAESVGREIVQMGRRSVEVEADLAAPGAAEAMVARCGAELGRLDILVNNAGGLITPIERSRPSQMSDEEMRTLFDANVLTMVHCCRAAAPVMTRQESGCIVNVSSAAARTTAARGAMAGYGAAKAAVTHFTRSLAAELGPHGIRANCIAPGVIWSSRVKVQSEARGIGRESESGHIPLGRYGTPEDCALVVEFLVTDLSRYVTGQCISVCGGSVLAAA
ncbi:SDR family NAD(P)-dependent oxidoreductase [Chelatococcus reniformis]|uniref:Beta-ketoacyl-ACP reductase n=1 Tax=Chelatococcus reniformis TaxID=1494448 RepID=A0A916UAA8_9HYPH|nr:SDR family NAD(P)-dependent oxidoreductase [Chelatococcus reniformis]GGC65586.1 beta-ketoacyl-ACP reductase [Chelatococcus reniformis]